MASDLFSLFFYFVLITQSIGSENSRCDLDSPKRIPHETSCHKFYECAVTTMTYVLRSCGQSQFFDEALEDCRPTEPFPSNKCKNKETAFIPVEPISKMGSKFTLRDWHFKPFLPKNQNGPEKLSLTPNKHKAGAFAFAKSNSNAKARAESNRGQRAEAIAQAGNQAEAHATSMSKGGDSNSPHVAIASAQAIRYSGRVKPEMETEDNIPNPGDNANQYWGSERRR